MVVISKAKLLKCGTDHPEAATALNEWWLKVKLANWKSLSDIKSTFNAYVDYIGNDSYVFNIKGNEFRLVAMIFFDIRTVFIRFVGTHDECDKIDCKRI